MQNLRKSLTCHSLSKTRQLKPVEKAGAGKTVEALPTLTMKSRGKLIRKRSK